ncbi:peroxiredoxin-like family protein [Winogradskyella marina]|nr:peroxiredoxin-like family protein [Winogradskyella marina]
MKIKILTLITCITLASCNNGKTSDAAAKTGTSDSEKKSETITFKNKGHELVYELTKKTGDYQTLLNKKDVVYTYTYQTPDGKKDVSTEKYIFNGELSYGAYKQHERTLPNLEGLIEQGYDGDEYWLKHKGNLITDDEAALKRVAFNRPTNFYWFAMLPKLLDPGVTYDYLGEKNIEDTAYDIVKIAFTSENNKPTDIYQVYINKDSGLVDQFLFTVADFGVMETPNLMQLEYEDIDGMLIPTKRQYKKSNWDAEVTDAPWIYVTWTNISFNNNLKKEEFKKENTMTNHTVTSLKSKLDEKKANFEKNADETKKRIYNEGFEDVKNSDILSQAKQVGDKAPNFVLKNAIGKTVALEAYLKEGPVVLTWYRGGWCPYCNLTLQQLQQELPNFKANNANLLALTPELPDQSISTTEKNDLEFEVLSDIGNKVAKDYGIVFTLTDAVASIYNKSFDMNSHNGDSSNALPLAATYIINEEGKIAYAFLDTDYRNRAEPSEITAFLKNNL